MSPVRMSCADHRGFDCRGLAEAFLFAPWQTRALLSRCPVSCRLCRGDDAEASVAGGIDDLSPRGGSPSVPAPGDGGSPSPPVPPAPFRYPVSTYALQGHRDYMEDEHAVALHGRFAGVYDGHFGGQVSQYLRQNLHAHYLRALAGGSRRKRRTARRAKQAAAAAAEAGGEAASEMLPPTASIPP